MKILIVTNMYPTSKHPFYGIFVQEHVEALRKLGAHIDVFFTNPKRTRAAYLAGLPALARKLRAERYNIIHAQHSYCVYQLSFVRSLLRHRAPVVFTIHEGEAFIPDSFCDPQADFLKRFVYSKRLKRWALELADYVVSVERRLPQVVGYQGPYEVIPPGVNTDLFHPMDQLVCRKALGLPEQGLIIFFPASPTSLKGFDLFQQSLAHLKLINIRVVTGGSIPHDQMPLYMNAADVIVQTSYFEASPMVVKEAMACNRPVVSTDVGDVREIFGDTPGCFLCTHDPKDIAEKIEQALRFNQPAQGRERILELGLSLEQTARKYLALYERLTQM
jgi:teichuronic acid biosynthesis glycosyltransferase TuaC